MSQKKEKEVEKSIKRQTARVLFPETPAKTVSSTSPTEGMALRSLKRLETPGMSPWQEMHFNLKKNRKLEAEFKGTPEWKDIFRKGKDEEKIQLLTKFLDEKRINIDGTPKGQLKTREQRLAEVQEKGNEAYVQASGSQPDKGKEKVSAGVSETSQRINENKTVNNPDFVDPPAPVSTNKPESQHSQNEKADPGLINKDTGHNEQISAGIDHKQLSGMESSKQSINKATLQTIDPKEHNPEKEAMIRAGESERRQLESVMSNVYNPRQLPSSLSSSQSSSSLSSSLPSGLTYGPSQTLSDTLDTIDFGDIGQTDPRTGFGYWRQTINGDFTQQKSELQKLVDSNQEMLTIDYMTPEGQQLLSERLAFVEKLQRNGLQALTEQSNLPYRKSALAMSTDVTNQLRNVQFAGDMTNANRFREKYNNDVFKIHNKLSPAGHLTAGSFNTPSLYI